MLVTDPLWLCNPALKRHDIIYPIVSEDDHLVCYKIPEETPGVDATLRDQFISGHVTKLKINAFLCVPFRKTGVVPSEESTWGEVKSIYR